MKFRGIHHLQGFRGDVVSEIAVSNGAMEAFNNLVARILHRCCGIRNLDYLWLKLRQESLAK